MDKNLNIEEHLSKYLAQEINKSIIKELMRDEEDRVKKVENRNYIIDEIISSE
jgi:hypothetical protein